MSNGWGNIICDSWYGDKKNLLTLPSPPWPPCVLQNDEIVDYWNRIILDGGEVDYEALNVLNDYLKWLKFMGLF